MTTIDARGLACPGPVLKTKEVIDRENPAMIQIIVDNDAARQNVSRFLSSRNFQASHTLQGNDRVITGTQAMGGKEAERPQSSAKEASLSTEAPRILVMITANRIGHGDDLLGEKLMKSFLATLKEMGRSLWRVVFLNSGVKLTIEGSESLPALRELEKEGIHILVCGTCLDHFHLLEKKQVGETTNMLDIMTSLELAEKVINL